MMGDEMTLERLVNELTGDAISKFAPEESILVESYDPSQANYGAAAGGPQGIGIETAITLALPFVYKFFEELIGRLAAKTADEITIAVKRWLAGEISSDDEELLNDLFREKLIAFGMPAEKALEASKAILSTLKENARKVISRT